MPNGICTIGIFPAGDFRWLNWSSKNKWGLKMDRMRAVYIPPR